MSGEVKINRECYSGEVPWDAAPKSLVQMQLSAELMIRSSLLSWLSGAKVRAPTFSAGIRVVIVLAEVGWVTGTLLECNYHSLKVNEAWNFLYLNYRLNCICLIFAKGILYKKDFHDYLSVNLSLPSQYNSAWNIICANPLHMPIAYNSAREIYAQKNRDSSNINKILLSCR